VAAEDTVKRLAWALCGACGAMLIVSATLPRHGSVPRALEVVGALALFVFPLVGALIVSRQPRHVIGWLFCVAGTLFTVSGLMETYGAYAVVEGHRGGKWAAWLGTWLFLVPLFGTPPLLFLLFPDGRPLSPRWRWAVALTGAAIVLQAAGAALAPGELVDAPVAGIENPAGQAGADALEGLGWTLSIAGIVLASVSLILRFRRARGDERLQLKWFAFAAAVFALSCVAAAGTWWVVGDLPQAGQALILAAFALIPVAAAIAILRHRLYDIDVVIRRTLVYAVLTATLAATYLASVLLVGLAVGESGFAVAVSTLAVAALFRPALGRIQALVDRRFYRRRYDAALTLEAFGARLRDELDLDSLGADLRGVVRETVQPAHVSLWLRKTR
jgi:hypothetical protein